MAIKSTQKRRRTIIIRIRAPKALWDALEPIAQAERRSRSFIVRELIERLLQERKNEAA